MDLLTNSALKVARACLRKYRLRYVEGWRAVREEGALRFGTLIHAGLEAWWLATQRGERGDERLNVALEALKGESDPFDLARARVLICGYDARWGDEEYEVLAVEHEFRVPLANPETGGTSRTFDLGGKLDVFVRDPLGRKLLVEHKTSAEAIGPGSEYMRRLQIDGQVSTYYAAVQALGHDVEGCVYDVIAKPTIRPLKATPPEKRKFKADGALYANMRAEDETPDEFMQRLAADVEADPDGYFQRAMVVRLESEMDEARTDTWQTAEIIRDAKRTQKFPRNPDACSHYGRTCEFFGVCTGTASLDDAGQFVKLTTPHPELSTTATAAAEA